MNVHRTCAVLIVGALLLGGCAPSAREDTAPAGDASGADAGPHEGFPVEVQNCGRTVTFDAPPQRIVSGWPTSTELLLELGVGERVVGQYNTSQGDPRQEYAEEYAAVPVLSEAAPTREGLLAADPDLLWADGTYLFDGQQLPTIQDLEASGTQVLVLSGFCDDGGASAVSDVDDDLATLGAALGLTDETASLHTDLADRLEAVAEQGSGRLVVDAMLVSTFDGSVFTYEGVYSDMLEMAGGHNVMEGTLPEGTFFGQLSVEELTSRDPGTMVYLLSGEETEDQARAYLRETFPTVAAVADGRIVFLPQIDSTNLRTVDGVEQLAAQLEAIG